MNKENPEKPNSRKTKDKKVNQNMKSMPKNEEYLEEQAKLINKKQTSAKVLEGRTYENFTEFFKAQKEDEGSTFRGKFSSNYTEFSSKTNETLKKVLAKHLMPSSIANLHTEETADPNDKSLLNNGFFKDLQIDSENTKVTTFDIEKDEASNNNSHIFELSLKSKATINKVIKNASPSMTTDASIQAKVSPTKQISPLPPSVFRLSKVLTPCLSNEYLHVLQAFTAIESSLSFIQLHGKNESLPLSQLSKLSLQLNSHCLTMDDIQCILGVFPSMIKVEWKENELYVSKSCSPEEQTKGKAALALAERRHTEFEAKLISLSKDYPHPPRGDLPSKGGKHDSIKGPRDFLRSCHDSFTETLWKRVEDERKKQEENLRTIEDENTREIAAFVPSQAQSNVHYQSDSGSNSIFKSQLIDMIKKKEAERKKIEETRAQQGKAFSFEAEEIIDLSNSIKLYYNNRKVSNMFLAQVIDRLSKTRSNGKLYSPAELSARLEFLIEISKGWILKVQNENGLLLRMNGAIPLSEVHAAIHKQWEAPSTADCVN